MAEIITMPRLSDTMEEGTIASWLKKVGDEISCKVKVLEARPSNSRPDCGVVTVQNDLFNQRQDLVYSAQNSFLILRCPII